LPPQFAELGAPTIDADTLAKQAVDPALPGFRAVVQRFGAGVVAADGSLNRAALGDIVFADDAARHALEEIIHPSVRAAIDRGSSRWTSGRTSRRDCGHPLLFETGRDKEFDVVVVAACAPETQKARLMTRDGFSESQADQRIRRRCPSRTKPGGRAT
jgi:dephospho-CoA kinase